jgi:NUDIX domain
VKDQPKQSRLGFVVVKLILDGENYFLMRKNLTWKDVSFIGGHEQPRDGGSLMRAARRELLEEVPGLRSFKSMDLMSLMENVAHGPIYSESAACYVEYTMSFFLLRFRSDPKSILEALGARSLNVLIRESDLYTEGKYKIAGLFTRLNDVLPGGVRAIPYSWDEDLGASVRSSGNSTLNQRDLALR